MTKPARNRSQIGKANLTKSKASERAVAAYLRVVGFPGAERTVRTGYHVAGRSSADRGDIDGTPGLCWQVKHVAQSRLHQVPEWLADTEAQRFAAGADLGILVVKRVGHAHPATWWAYLQLHQLVWLAGGTLAVDRDTPVRMELAALVGALRRAGYGTPLPCPALASGEAVDCTCGDPAACGERYATSGAAQEAS